MEDEELEAEGRVVGRNPDGSYVRERSGNGGKDGKDRKDEDGEIKENVENEENRCNDCDGCNGGVGCYWEKGVLNVRAIHDRVLRDEWRKRMVEGRWGWIGGGRVEVELWVPDTRYADEGLGLGILNEDRKELWRDAVRRNEAR